MKRFKPLKTLFNKKGAKSETFNYLTINMPSLASGNDRFTRKGSGSYFLMEFCQSFTRLVHTFLHFKHDKTKGIKCLVLSENMIERNSAQLAQISYSPDYSVNTSNFLLYVPYASVLDKLEYSIIIKFNAETREVVGFCDSTFLREGAEEDFNLPYLAWPSIASVSQENSDDPLHLIRAMAKLLIHTVFNNSKHHLYSSNSELYEKLWKGTLDQSVDADIDMLKDSIIASNLQPMAVETKQRKLN